MKCLHIKTINCNECIEKKDNTATFPPQDYTEKDFKSLWVKKATKAGFTIKQAEFLYEKHSSSSIGMMF